MNLRAAVLIVATIPLLACPRTSVVDFAPDGSTSPDTADAGWTLSNQRLDAWLAWHAQLAALRRTDAGTGRLESRALFELSLATDAGLSPSDIDRIEDVVAVFVTERNVERLSGALAITQFKGALADLSDEQRAKAEAAFAEVSAKTTPSPLPALEARFGPDALKVLLAREAEVTRTWDALLESR